MAQKTNGNPFHIERLKRDYAYEMKADHAHNGYEIYYLFSGERVYFIKDRTYHVKAGDLVLINRYELHRTSQASEPFHERILVNFHPDFLKNIEVGEDIRLFDIFDGTPVLHLLPDEQSFVETQLYRLEQEQNSGRPGSKLYMQLLLTELMLFIFRKKKEEKQQVSEYAHPMHQKISEIVQYINEHFHENISLPLLSERYHISRYYLSRLFKEVTGFNFSEYLNHVRIKEAQRILRSTENMKMFEVAEKVGYDNPTHFTRVFKSIAGTSPMHYKKQSHLS